MRSGIARSFVEAQGCYCTIRVGTETGTYNNAGGIVPLVCAGRYLVGEDAAWTSG